MQQNSTCSKHPWFMDSRLGSRILNAALADADIGFRVASRAQEASPGSAKFSALTKDQRTWLWNRIKNKYWKQLSDEAVRYYQNLGPDGDLVLQEKAVLLDVLGAAASASSSSAAPPSRKFPAIAQRPRVEGEDRRKQSRTVKVRFGKRVNAVKTLSDAFLKFSKAHRPTVCKLIRRVVSRVDETLPGTKYLGLGFLSRIL